MLSSLLPSRSLLGLCRQPAVSQQVSSSLGPLSIFARHRSALAPKKIKFIKRHKGTIPIPIGGSIKGTTLAFGQWGIRIKGNGARITQKQLLSAEEVIKRKMKIIKGAQVWLRLFPDIPVCIKGNETRMGKGKGTFEFWATRVPKGRVIFEIGGPPIREELAREAFRQACSKLPTTMEFINRSTPPRLGNLILHPPKPTPETIDTIDPSQPPVEVANQTVSL